MEEKLLLEFKDTDKRIIFVRGVVEEVQTKGTINNITLYNYLSGKDLEEAINKSEVILSRSGYTTLMDIAKLKKKAFFIPTPGQTEQEYLAKRLKENGISPSCSQNRFKAEKLREVDFYNGLSFSSSGLDWSTLFSLF